LGKVGSGIKTLKSEPWCFSTPVILTPLQFRVKHKERILISSPKGFSNQGSRRTWLCLIDCSSHERADSPCFRVQHLPEHTSTREPNTSQNLTDASWTVSGSSLAPRRRPFSRTAARPAYCYSILKVTPIPTRKLWRHSLSPVKKSLSRNGI
jgi:hypothetical protein